MIRFGGQLGPAERASARERLVVACTVKSYVARDFDQPGWRVVHNQGLWLPEVDPAEVDAWWMPTEHATWMTASGYPVRLVAPGPHWLPLLNPEALGRPVHAVRVRELTAEMFPAWAKLAEVKVDAVPSRRWETLAQFQAAAASCGVRAESWVQVSRELPELAKEWRCFVADGVVVACSLYRDEGQWWEPGMTVSHPADAVAFATEVLADAPVGLRSYVLDVARLREGRWVVIEANPSWSAGLYDADPAAVLECLALASLGPAEACEWAYQPDPYLQAQVAGRRPLR